MEYLKTDKSVNEIIPLVSVCVTTYNHELYIAEALESILAQETDFDFEIILGEDDSSDNTRAICVEYAEKYPDKVRLFLNDREDVIYIDGVATGRWNLINNLNHARGKYIALLEGDDYWICDKKLQTQVDFLEKNTGYAICFHNSYVLNTKNSHETKMTEYQDFSWSGLDRSIDQYSLSDLISSPLCPTASVVFRKPEVFEFPEWFNKVPSGDMALEAIVCGNSKIKYLDYFCSVYRKRPGGVTIFHRDDYIQKGRAIMYLGFLEYFDGDYKNEIRKVLKSHLVKINDWSLFTSSEISLFMKLFPIFMLRKNIGWVLRRR